MKKFIEPRFGQRIRQLRETRSCSQNDLAAAVDLKDRQIVSQIEGGHRRISVDELLKVARFFGVSLEDLSNPFLLTNEKAFFSWRQTCVPAADLSKFEVRAGEWIGAYRELNDLNGKRLRTIMPRLALTHTSMFEDATAAGEAVASELDLGPVPAGKLAETMETKLGILVLMVDAIRGVSGAACRLPELNTVLINRNETAARRNFDLAHELFHVMTWDKMPPARLDGGDEAVPAVKKTPHQKRLDRIERLANNFASGILMPSAVLDALGKPRGEVAPWLSAAANELGVSGQALKYRMINSGRLPKSIDVADSDLTSNARCRGTEQAVPPLFSKAFIKTIAAAIEGGHLSGRRAAGLLDTTTDDLGDLCEVYGISRPVEL